MSDLQLRYSYIAAYFLECFYRIHQVLSKSVADTFSTLRELEPDTSLWKGTKETERFCRMFDRFFDCLNTRNLTESMKKRKPDLRAYFSEKDSRFEV